MNEVSPGGSQILALLQALGGRGGRRTQRMLTALAITETVSSTWRGFAARARSERQYVIAVPGDDAMYPDVHAWVLNHLAPAQRHAMIARTSRRDDAQPPSDIPAAPRVRLFFDGQRAQTVTIDGHPIRVEVEKPDWSNSRLDEQPWKSALERVTFTARSAAGRDAIVEWLNTLAAEQTKRRPKLRVAGKWGGWSGCELPPRGIDTVILRRGQREQLLDDMRRFLDAELDYAKLGLPWHRGYLFHGQPGTGKTSTASALAGHLGLDVYYVALGSLDNDQALIDALTAVQPRSMLLMEDIDVVHGAKSRDDTAGGVSLAGLLNTLDGLVTPHGLVTVMTTNNRELLDPALLRPGRIDVESEMLPCDENQIHEICRSLLGVTGHIPPLNGHTVTPAQVVSVLKHHLDNPFTALEALQAWLWEYCREAVA